MASAELTDCRRCPRLVGWLDASRADHPDWWGRPVPAWGPADAPVLVVGLAPGYRGANRTGRPFTGDQSGVWLYRALHEVGLAEAAEPGSVLRGARITNAVKCCPPENQPTAAEVRTCRSVWFEAELAASPARVCVALGALAHAQLVDAPFAHGAEHVRADGRVVLDSYHPSPLNTRTGRLSWDAFRAIFARAARI